MVKKKFNKIVEYDYSFQFPEFACFLIGGILFFSGSLGVLVQPENFISRGFAGVGIILALLGGLVYGLELYLSREVYWEEIK